MKFMVIGLYNDLFYPLFPETLKELTDATGPCSEKHTKEDTLEESCNFGNMKGMMAVYDLNSAEDLVRLAENPAFPFIDAEITPLVDIDVVRKVQAKK
jgi:hypothetical protein